MVEKPIIEIDNLNCLDHKIIVDNFESINNFLLIERKEDGYLYAADDYSIPFDSVQSVLLEDVTYNIFFISGFSFDSFMKNKVK